MPKGNNNINDFHTVHSVDRELIYKLYQHQQMHISIDYVFYY